MSRTTYAAAMVLLALASLPLTRLSAQDPRAERLRQQLELRFANQVRQQLGLTDEQEPKVREIMSRYAQQRRAMEVEERAARQALNHQLRPGIAADGDSVTKLVDRITEGRVVYMQLMRDELRDLGAVLNPVQRGQLFFLRDRILQRAQELREQRPNPPGGRP